MQENPNLSTMDDKYFGKLENFGASAHQMIALQELYAPSKKFKLREDDIGSVLRPLVIFGKIIGLLPWGKFRVPAIPALMMLVNVLVEIIGIVTSDEINKKPFDLVATFGVCFFYSLGFFTYTYMYRKSQRLSSVIEVWRRTSLPHFEMDKRFYRDANCIAFFVFFSAIPENIVYHLRACMGPNDHEFLACTYRTMHVTWPRLVPYHPFTSAYLIFTNKLALYSWNFMDVIIAMICRGLAFRFRSLAKQKPTPKAWSTLRSDYNMLVEAYEQIQIFLNPMVFASFAMNTYALCMQLNMWLTPSKNVTIWDNVYTLWSSLHLVVRVLVVSINAANVNDGACRVHEIIRNCPTECYNLEIIRLEEAGCSVAINGLGCFTISKNFILSLITVVFTFEVVLLQAVPSCP